MTDSDISANLVVGWECERSIRMARLSYLFANDKLDRNAACDIINECQMAAEWFPLETFDLNGVMRSAEEFWANDPTELKPLVEQACLQVWRKWDGQGDAASAAEDWATDLIAEYAVADGVNLVHRL